MDDGYERQFTYVYGAASPIEENWIGRSAH
jgi:hypothetical protein